MANVMIHCGKSTEKKVPLMIKQKNEEIPLKEEENMFLNHVM